MKNTSLSSAAASAAIALLSISNASAASDPTGVWVNDTGRGAIEIKSCGGALCGYVVAVKDPNDTKGCGKQIIGDAQSVGGGRWDNGWIYSPEKRKNYDVELKPLDDGTLRVVGYAGTKLFSRTMIWTRAPADLARCGTTDAKATVPLGNSVTAATEAKNASPAASASASAPAAKSAAPAATADGGAGTAKPDVASSGDVDKSASVESKSADASANDEADAGGETPGERKKGGGIKFGDLNLDNVLTKTKSGKCKLDLPWVKVQFDCERD